MFSSIIHFDKVLVELITNWRENQTFSANRDENEFRDVGSISNLGGARRFEGTFSFRKRAFFKNRIALLCLLQNLGGTCPPPAPTSMNELDNDNRKSTLQPLQ